MAQYLRKPEVIEAKQFQPHVKPWPYGVEMKPVQVGHLTVPHYRLVLQTGELVLHPGDYVVYAANDQRYIIPRLIFEAEYELVINTAEV